MSNSTRILKVNIGNETRPVIENISLNKNDNKEKLFSDQYKLAFSAIDGYISSLNNIENRNGVKIENNNNIFAFCGDRGSGKTSCMMSVAYALTNNHYESDLEQIKEKKFFSICNEDNPTIDPSFFDDNHNILEIVIAQMYRRFFEENKKNQYQDDSKDYKRRHLCEKFERVQESLLELTKKENDSIGGIEKLGNLSAAIYMQNDIKELVKSYLSFMHDEENGLLILPIDDIDLNSKQAVDMMEQIRKYFIVDNIVILIAVKIDQLTMLKRQQNMSDYKTLLKDGKISFEEIDTMTERYISKLIPISQRIFMPDSREWRSYKLIINSKKDGDLPTFESVRIGVLDLIYKKTRYLFYNTDVKTCYLVPENLRELRLLLRLLYNMPEITGSDIKTNEANHQLNQEVLKKYFFETWAENNISSDDRKRIMSLYNLTDVSSFNASALRILIDKFNYLKEIRDSNKTLINKDQDAILYELFNLTSPYNKVYNISLGDVLGVIDILEKQETEEENLKFLFLIKALYSIRLYEYYDELTYKNEKGEIVGQPASIESEVISTSRANLCKFNYHRLIGGSFINSRIFEYISKEGNKKSRTNRIISIKQINANLKNFVEDNCIKKDANKTEIRLYEFFMLCTFGSGLAKTSGEIDKNFRRSNTAVFNEDLSKKEFAVFDLSSFFFNITRVEECYSRFEGGKKFFEAAKNELNDKDIADKGPISLYALFHREATQRSEGKTQEWLSWASIRNIDVLLSLFKFEESDTGDSYSTLLAYFQKLAGKTLSTYGTKEKKYPIDFNFCGKFSEWFDNAKELSSLNDTAKELFYQIFELKSDIAADSEDTDPFKNLTNEETIKDVWESTKGDKEKLKDWIKKRFKIVIDKPRSKFSKNWEKLVDDMSDTNEDAIMKLFKELNKQKPGKVKK